MRAPTLKKTQHPSDFRRTGPTCRRLLAAKAYQRVSMTSGICAPFGAGVRSSNREVLAMLWRPLVTISLLGCGAALSAQPVTTKLDAVAGVPEIDRTSQTEDLNFKNERDDRLTVSVRLAGAGPYQFLVDTGADRTAVSREIATRLNLQSGDGAELHTVTGVSTVRTARVHNFALTRTPESSVDAAVLDRVNIGAD